MNYGIIYTFIDYLDQKDALVPFKNQLQDRVYKSNSDLKTYLHNLLIKERSLTEAINFAFIWADTNEGRVFWSNLNTDWKAKLNRGELVQKLYNSIW
jgi:hypothetical protein